MDISKLVGHRVRVCAHDFSADDFFPTDVDAVIRKVDVDSGSMLLESVMPGRIGSRVYSFMVAQPRSRDDGLDTLMMSKALSCCITCIPHERFDPENPFDLSWWRGGGAMMTAITLE